MSLIRIHRNSQTIDGRVAAISRLNEITHYAGQPVMTKYLNESGKVDTIFSIGIKDGIGQDCYKVISLGGLELIHGIVTELPESIENGHAFLYLDNTEWKYVYNDGNQIITENMPTTDTTYVNIVDSYKWFWKDNSLKREDDFLSRKEVGDYQSFIKLVSFVAENPTTGLVIGNKWYNINTKKIFIAVSDNLGEEVEPKDNTVYFNLDENRIYYWNNSTQNMVPIGDNTGIDTVKITDVTEIL